MGIQNMTLFGHSLGGYLSTCYAIKHPNRINHLVLCSPVGFPEQPQPARKLPWIVDVMWRNAFTPQAFIRAVGPFGPKLLKGYTDRRFKQLQQSELDLLHQYLYNISVDTGSGEYAIAHLFYPGAWAIEPLLHRFHQVSCKTDFIYGQSDWMDRKGADACIHSANQKVHVTPGGHHMYLDDHEAFNALLLRILQ